MCGRYMLDQDASNILEASYPIKEKSYERREGEIFPSQKSPIIKAREEGLALASYKWGFSLKRPGPLVINARSESLEDKALFKEALRKNRIAIPMSLFYEWDKSKIRHEFFLEGQEIFYVLGLGASFEGEESFTMLTCQANSTVKKVHSRMPLIVRQEELKKWILSDDYMDLVRPSQAQLSRDSDMDQLSFF